MAKYGKESSSTEFLQRLKEYQKSIYHNANAKWANELRVYGKNPNDEDKYDIDLKEIKDSIKNDCAHYLPIENHNGEYFTGSHTDYYVNTKWYPCDTQDLFNSHMSDETTRSLMYKIGWCDEQGSPVQIDYNLNKNGFRFKNFNKQNGKGIIFLGCSHTFGVGLNQEDSFAYKVSDYFNRECFNFGMPGKGLDTSALYTSCFIHEDIEIEYVDAVVVYCPPAGRTGYFTYQVRWQMDNPENELLYQQLQNDYLTDTNFYDNTHLEDINFKEMNGIIEKYNLSHADSKQDIKEKMQNGLDKHVHKHRSDMWEHFMFTKENNFYRGLLAINSIKSFCMENNIPLIVQEGNPGIANQVDWARDLGHFGKQTHTNIANDIISKLELYIDK